MGGNAQQSRHVHAQSGLRSRGFSVQHCGIAEAPAERLGLSINANPPPHGGRFVRASARQPLRDGTLSDEVRVALTEGLGTAPATGPSPMGPEWGYFPGYTCAFGGKIIPLKMELRWPREDLAALSSR
jgi:hypothetical protein